MIPPYKPDIYFSQFLSNYHTLFSQRMKCRRSPCFMYGSTTRGSPSWGRRMPRRDSTLLWWKPFMMIPSFKNCSTSSSSVIPEHTRMHINVMDLILREVVTRKCEHILLIFWRTKNERNLMILTIQRLDSTVDFSVVLVCKIAVIDSAKMTCRGKKTKHIN